MRPWIGSLALILVSCNSSTNETTNSVGTTSAQEDPAYVDFAPQASTDGTRQVFLSRRDAGAYRVYLYNEAAETKLSALSKSIAIETGVDELGTSLSDDGAWILTWRFGAKSQLLLNSFDTTQQHVIELDLDSRLRELTFAPSGQNPSYFAYTARKDGVDSVHIYSFTPGNLGTAAEEIAFDGEYGTQFAVSGSTVYAFTRKVSTAGQVTVQYRKRSTGGAWDLQGTNLTLNTSDVATPSAASALGLIYAKTLDAVRLKTKVGTFVSTSTEYQKNVGVIQEALQFQGFSGTAFNFDATAYRASQPLTLGSISATADGAYLLLTGYDAWFCKNRTLSNNYMLLVKTSDGSSLPILITRNNSTIPWTDVVSDQCAYYDQEPIPQVKDFDVTVSNGQILSVTGNRVTLIYESKYTGDREIRRLSFDVSDWAAKTYANPVFTNISANTR